jgi:hypothetical protein
VATASPGAAPEHVPDPASFPGAFAYEHTDIPPGMSARAYRRACAARQSMAGAVTRRALLAFVAWTRSRR